MKISNIPSYLEHLKEQNLFREVKEYTNISSTKCLDSEGKEYLYFNSNNYLGLAFHKEVIEAGKEAFIHGASSTGSRLTSGCCKETKLLEEKIKKIKHTEDAIIFNTGYMTNLGVLYALGHKEDIFFSDRLNHASLIDGCRISKAETVIFEHRDINHLRTLLETTPCNGQRFIITDGVFSMDGDLAPIKDLVELKKEFDACLIVDDAHAMGVIGEQSLGSSDYFNLEAGDIDIQIGTLSKALGSEGGYVASSKDICLYLRNTSRPFIFSTSLPPSVTTSALKALELMEKNGSYYHKELSRKSLLMRNLLKEGNIPVIEGFTPIIPIMIQDSYKAILMQEKLKDQGLIISAIRPPSVPKGMSRLRLTVCLDFTDEEIILSAKKIIEIWKEINESPVCNR